MKAFRLSVILLTALAPTLQAQEAGTAPLSLELNAATPTDGGCTLSFLARNGHDAEISKVVYETVLFDDAGQVERLTLLDFGALPPGRPRVRQFTLTGLSCDGLSRVLVNGAETCEAGDLGSTAFTDGLELGTRTEIEVIG